MSEKKSTDKSITKKKTYYKRKCSKEDLERFERNNKRHEEIAKQHETKSYKDGKK